ncbi:MAG: hypothetical protein AAF764_09320, partial [Pseudomonadota bacterium]
MPHHIRQLVCGTAMAAGLVVPVYGQTVNGVDNAVLRGNLDPVGANASNANDDVFVEPIFDPNAQEQLASSPVTSETRLQDEPTVPETGRAQP